MVYGTPFSGVCTVSVRFKRLGKRWSCMVRIAVVDDDVLALHALAKATISS